MKYVSPALIPVLPIVDTSHYETGLIRYVRRYRRVPLSRGRHHGGRIFLNHDHEMVRVESHEEAVVAKVLGGRPDFCRLLSQPLTVWFRWQGRVHRYTPDLEVWLNPISARSCASALGAHFLVEVKPENWTGSGEGVWGARAKALNDAVGLPLIILDRKTAEEIA